MKPRFTFQHYWKKLPGYPLCFMFFTVVMAKNYLTIELFNFRLTIEREDGNPFMYGINA